MLVRQDGGIALLHVDQNIRLKRGTKEKFASAQILDPMARETSVRNAIQNFIKQFLCLREYIVLRRVISRRVGAKSTEKLESAKYAIRRGKAPRNPLKFVAVRNARKSFSPPDM